MTFIDRNLPRIAAAAVALLIGITAATAYGQDRGAGTKDQTRTFCSDNNWSSDSNQSSHDLRQMTLPATGSITVDSNKNGGISVQGEDRADIQLRACVQAWGKTEDAAKSLISSIKINTGSTISAEGPSDEGWSVSFELMVPRSTNLNLTAHNGGISIRGVDGTATFETTNGGVSLSDVAGEVKGHTQNGGVYVQLTGASWKGTGLDVTTTNGGVKIEMPANYAAHVETATVNGGYKSDIPALNVTREDVNGSTMGRSRSTTVSTDLNGGGAPIRVVTTNGGVKIGTPGGEK